MTPAWWNSASTASSEPASAAVCEPAARIPARLRPLFMARIGLRRATRARDPAEAARVAERLEVDQHESVPASSSKCSSRSLEETSALLPTDTNADRPSPRAAASARKARPSAPLWDEKPMLPAGMWVGPNVALSRADDDGDAEAVGPDQPASVRAHEREQRVLALGALAPTSANPAEMTHSARTPRAAPSSAASNAARPARR